MVEQYGFFSNANIQRIEQYLNDRPAMDIEDFLNLMAFRFFMAETEGTVTIPSRLLETMILTSSLLENIGRSPDASTELRQLIEFFSDTSAALKEFAGIPTCSK